MLKTKLIYSMRGASALLLALGLTAAHAESDLHPVQVEMLDSCHKGLVVWKALKNEPKCGYVQVPQVKIFDGAGQLRFIGSALDAIQWVKSGQPGASIPENVLVRDAASEARVTHVTAPAPGRGWVAFYISKGCPPCEKHLALFRSDAMPKLGLETTMSVFEI